MLGGAAGLLLGAGSPIRSSSVSVSRGSGSGGGGGLMSPERKAQLLSPEYALRKQQQRRLGPGAVGGGSPAVQQQLSFAGVVAAGGVSHMAAHQSTLLACWGPAQQYKEPVVADEGSRLGP